jgi:hypothetical protein
VVAATLEKALTYESAESFVWDREVGGSNPLAPTKSLTKQQKAASLSGLSHFVMRL